MTISTGIQFDSQITQGQSELEMRAITAPMVPIRRFCGSLRIFLQQRLNFLFFFFFVQRELLESRTQTPIPEARGGNESSSFSRRGSSRHVLFQMLYQVCGPRGGTARAGPRKGNGAGGRAASFRAQWLVLQLINGWQGGFMGNLLVCK